MQYASGLGADPLGGALVAAQPGRAGKKVANAQPSRSPVPHSSKP